MPGSRCTCSDLSRRHGNVFAEGGLEMRQLWAAWKLIAFMQGCAASTSPFFRITVRDIPGFAVHRLDGFQFLLRECFVYGGKLLGNNGIKFTGHFIQFFLQRIDARDLIVGWTAFIVQDGAVKLRRFFTDSLLTGDGSSFR